MPKIVILTAGQRFGKWTLLAEAPMHVARSGRTEKKWHCRCDCGTEKTIQQAKLRSGETLSCGCFREDHNARTAAELIGKRFGRLTIIAEAERYVGPKSGKLRRQWRCRCDCGNETVVVLKKLKSGATKSCGCYSRDMRVKHGHNPVSGKSPTYRIWDAMIQRCTNADNAKFYMYGGRGITVCERWRTFEYFLEDMGERPEGMSIDRTDNNGNYEPSNCRWATRKEQQRNMRRNHLVEYLGRRMTVAEAAEIAGVKGNNLYPLLNRRGMSIDEAIHHVGGQP